MTVPFWCLLVAAMIPLVLAWVAGYFRHRQFGTVDNKEPRLQYTQLTGAGARAVAAQQNAWEALAIFTGAVLVAHLAGADAARSALAAQLFVAARLLHAAFYIANWDILRSVAFIAGLACSIWLFVMAA